MGRRRKEKLLDILIRLPWWAGVAGVVIVLAIRPLVLAGIASVEMLKPVIPQFSFLFYLVAFLFAVGALASFVRQWCIRTYRTDNGSRAGAHQVEEQQLT